MSSGVEERNKLIYKHKSQAGTGTMNPSYATSPSTHGPSRVKADKVSFMKSPMKYGAYVFRAGGQAGSVFSLIAATLGSGTISFAYAVMMNGYVMGPLLIVVGALLSYYTGILIVRCAEHTGRDRYEDIALALFGQRVSRVVSAFYLVCLMGFTFSYIVYVKGAIP